MEIKIFSRGDLENFLDIKPKEYHVIQYTNSEYPIYPYIVKNAVSYCHMPIEDIDHYEYKSQVAPKAVNIKKFLDFSKDIKKLAVACAAGVSRSSATAYLIACRELGVTEALKVLQPGRHFPNRLIVYIGSRLLEDNNIWNKYVEWVRNYEGIDSSQSGGWPKSSLILKMGFDEI